MCVVVKGCGLPVNRIDQAIACLACFGDILPAIMSNLIAFIVVLIALVFAMIIIRQKPKSLGEFFAALFDLINSDKPAKAHRADPVQSFPYRSKGQLLSKGEMAFFHALKKVVGEQSAIAMKVRLADIITCPGSEWNKGHGNRILQKHVDFVLIDPNSTSIQAVIEWEEIFKCKNMPTQLPA